MGARRSGSSICYVVPSFRTNTDEHLAHLPPLLERVGSVCDLYVIVERGELPAIRGARSVHLQRTNPSHRVSRYVELLRLAWRVRRNGCRRFFIRISRGAALALLIAQPFLGIEVYYWNSGQVRRGWPRSRSRWMSIRLWADDQLLKFIVRRADRLVTGPESMVDYYVRTYGVDRMRIVTLYNDVDTSRYRPPPDDERSRLREALGLPPGRCVLFVGRVSRYKGGEFLVPLQGGLASDGPDDAYLTVVGPIHLHELAGPLERARNVVLTGSKPNDDVIRYMQVADVFILPSLSEGFPRVVIEAMAAGVPVVAFDVGGVRDILGPAQRQLIVRSGDVQAMLTGVRRILADPELAAGLRSENLEQVKRFDTEVVADMFVERIVKG